MDCLNLFVLEFVSTKKRTIFVVVSRDLFHDLKIQVASAALSGLSMTPESSPLFISIMAGVAISKLSHLHGGFLNNKNHKKSIRF